jgi:DNA-binding response OmpR family regulator
MVNANPRKLVIIDDDREFVALLTRFLAGEGYSLLPIFDGVNFLSTIETEKPALIILDIKLPSVNGLDILRQIQGAGFSVPVLILSGRGDENDRILGLDLGADDYLPKPCNPRELLARIRSILRRTGQIKTAQPLVVSFGDLMVDRSRHTIFVGEESMTVTGAEFRIIDALVRAMSNVVTRERLTEIALGRKISAFDRAVDTHISNLCRKLVVLGCHDLEIRGVRGVGYLLVKTPSES